MSNRSDDLPQLPKAKSGLLFRLPTAVFKIAGLSYFASNFFSEAYNDGAFMRVLSEFGTVETNRVAIGLLVLF